MSGQKTQIKTKKRKTATVIVSVVLGILTVFVLAVLIFSIWLNSNFFVVIVDGTSMNDTLQSGDRLYAGYDVDAGRGDIIVIDATNDPTFGNSDGSERLLIKRLIAVEGDCVKCEDGVVYLKEKGGEYYALSEPYLNQTTADFEEVVVGAGEIFFLGDNRANSKDARASGCLLYENIIGVVPGWSVTHKAAITGWEGFKKSVADFFTIDTVHKTGG